MSLRPAVDEFVSAVRAAQRPHDGQIVVSQSVAGGYQITGPRKVSGRAVDALANGHGVKWSATFADTAGGRVALLVSPTSGWQAPRPCPGGGGNTSTAVTAWIAAQPGLTASASTLIGKAAGSVIPIVCTASGVLTGEGVADVLALPGVVNVWIKGGGFEVWIARDTGVAGALQHLAAVRKLSSRLGPRRGGASKTGRRARRLRHRGPPVRAPPYKERTPAGR